MVGADIANICNEAAICAARLNKDAVELSDFEKAIDRVIGGLEKKNKVITADEKKIIAHHEVFLYIFPKFHFRLDMQLLDGF